MRPREATEAWRQWWEEHGRRELRCILMTAWDPAGVGDTPEAWDEYDTYATSIAGTLRDATGPDAVAELLTHIERQFMGIERPGQKRDNTALAHTLQAWQEWSFVRGARPPREWTAEP